MEASWMDPDENYLISNHTDLTGIGLTFFIVACMALHFEFVTKTIPMTDVLAITEQGFLFFSHSAYS